MATMPSSGAISFNNLRTVFGGTTAPITNYYRGGGRVPSSTSSTTTEGPNYVFYGGPPNYFNTSVGEWYWGGRIGNNPGTSFFVDPWTYYRGAFVQNFSTKDGTIQLYRIYRQQSTTTSVNTGVPSSGTISLNQFYGATS